MTICPDCGEVVKIGNWPFCPHGETGSYAEHGDELDYVDHNLGREPIRIRSKAERRRIMKERGLVEMVRHVPHPEGPKKNHTVDWSCAADEYTMNYKRELLERAFTNPIEKESNRPVMNLDVHDMSKEELIPYLEKP